MKRFLLALGALILLAGPVAAADDSVEARRAAAQRYAATMDLPNMMGESINQMAMTLPAEHRSAFVKAMNDNMDIARLEELTVGMMIRLFTAGELTALADFYGTPTGQSILKKMPQMMSGLMPIMQEQMARTLERAQKRQQDQQNKGSKL